MKTHESEDQVTLIPQAIGLAQESLDLVVDPLHPAVVDSVLPPGQNAALVAEERSGHLPHLGDARLVGPRTPLAEEGPHLVVGGLLPEQDQRFLEQIRGEQGFVVLECTAAN